MPRLTPRESEVLLWAMEGKSNWEISVILGISQESIKGHIANTLHKLDASNRAHAVAIALQSNLLFPFGLPRKDHLANQCKHIVNAEFSKEYHLRENN